MPPAHDSNQTARCECPGIPRSASRDLLQEERVLGSSLKKSQLFAPPFPGPNVANITFMCCRTMVVKGGENGRPVIQMCASDSQEVTQALRRKKSNLQSSSNGGVSSSLNLVSICGPARTGKSLLLTVSFQEAKYSCRLWFAVISCKINSLYRT